MENTTLSYCKDMVRKHDYARYLQCAFVPHAYAYYALMAELAHIHDHVSEEMIGHIRYAWWREQLDQLGAAHQQHPVLQALSASGIARETLTLLVDCYREAWPELPQNPPELEVDDPRWKKVDKIIATHGNRSRWWLVVKLFLLSCGMR